MQNEDATLKTLRTFGRTSDLHADIPKGEFKFTGNINVSVSSFFFSFFTFFLLTMSSLFTVNVFYFENVKVLSVKS